MDALYTDAPRGAKGGKGGSPRQPVEAPDSLRSRAYARVVDLVSEGEIQGLVNGWKSVLLDGVPLQNADGSYNFGDPAQGELKIDYRKGTQGQTAMDAFAAQETEQVVNVEVTAAASVTRTVSNVNVDAVRVTLSIPALSSTDTSNGDVSGTSVEWAIDVQSAGGGFVEKFRQTISGKTVSGYQRSVRVELEGAAPWDVRVRRITADSTTQYLLNKTYWTSYTEIIDTRLRYPNSAVFGLAVDAQRFSRIPVRGYDLMGVRCRVPVNYDPIARTYAGVWDGTFKIAWTNNPAWCFYEIATHTRWGLGRHVDAALLNKWALYTIGQYCDQAVPDGRGGTEPRFTLNVYLQTQAEAYDLLQALASAFRGMVFWGAGGIDFAQDAPADPTALYTNANVVDGSFEYADTSAKVRHTVAIVQWNDPSDQFRAKQVYVEDEDGIKRYGVIPTPIVAFGCTSQGQAVRAGKWLLYSEINETEVVSFRVGMDGIFSVPGQVIRVADRRKAGERTGGRIRSATTTAVTLDAAVTLNAGETYTLYVLDPDNAQPVQGRAVTNGAGTWDVLNLASALPAAPTAHSVWVLSSDAVQPTTWRVVAVGEVEGKNEFQLTAVAHNPSKYAAIEQGLKLEAYPVSRLTAASKPVTGLSLSESLFMDGAVVRVKLTVAFIPQQPHQSYAISWRRALSTWQRLPQTTQQTVDILGVEPGEHEVTVVAINALGNASAPVSGSIDVLGKTAPPERPDFFTVQRQPDGTREFAWGWIVTPKPLDLEGYLIRYKAGTSAAWADMTPFQTDDGFFTASPLESNQLLAGSYVFEIRTRDTSGNVSADGLQVVIDLGDPRQGNVVAQVDCFLLGWPGTKTGCQIIGPYGWLEAIDSTTWATLPATWDAWTRWNVTPTSPITYQHTTIDLAAVIPVRPIVQAVAQGTLTIEEQHSNDNVTYSAWATVGSGFTARYVRIRVSVAANGANPVPTLQSCTIFMDGRLEREVLNDINPAALTGSYRIGTGDIRAPITKTYAKIVAVQVTVQNATTNITAIVMDKNTSPGPRIQFRDKADALVDPPLVDIEIEGY